MRPQYPWRVKMFVYGCAQYAHREEMEKAGGGAQKRAVTGPPRG